jgi:hypothetical protein
MSAVRIPFNIPFENQSHTLSDIVYTALWTTRSYWMGLILIYIVFLREAKKYVVGIKN